MFQIISVVFVRLDINIKVMDEVLNFDLEPRFELFGSSSEE
jgi:hypothetical protein